MSLPPKRVKTFDFWNFSIDLCHLDFHPPAPPPHICGASLEWRHSHCVFWLCLFKRDGREKKRRERAKIPTSIGLVQTSKPLLLKTLQCNVQLRLKTITKSDAKSFSRLWIWIYFSLVSCKKKFIKICKSTRWSHQTFFGKFLINSSVCHLVPTKLKLP